jgi:segregation and condensation protein B
MTRETEERLLEQPSPTTDEEHEVTNRDSSLTGRHSDEPVVVDKGVFPVPVPEPAQPAEAKDRAEESQTGPRSAPPGLSQIIEALLFAAPAPVSASRLSEIAGGAPEALNQAIEQLNRDYESARRAYRIHRVAQGFQLYTLSDYAQWVRQLFKTQRAARLSRASLETLSIVAYRQPVTKPEVEQLRGVDSTAPILTLLERRLIVPAGRARKPGNPFLYRTSREFLRYFGLADLDHLPSRDELEEFLRARANQAEGEELELDRVSVQDNPQAETPPTAETPDALPSTQGEGTA